MRKEYTRALQIVRQRLTGTLIRTSLFFAIGAIPAGIASMLIAGESAEDTWLWRTCYRDTGELVSPKERVAIALGQKPSCVNNARAGAQALVLVAWLALAIGSGFAPLAKEILRMSTSRQDEDWADYDWRCTPENAREALKAGASAAIGFGIGTAVAASFVAPGVFCPAQSQQIARVEALGSVASLLGEEEIKQALASGRAPSLNALVQSVHANLDLMDWDYYAVQTAKEKARACASKGVTTGSVPAIAVLSLLALACVQKPAALEEPEE